MDSIEKQTEHSRYSDVLEDLLRDLGAEDVLRLDYESDYQGFVDIDALLEDGRVFSYYYGYWSCSGCDEWEHQGYSDSKIKEIMSNEATFFSNKKEYLEYRETLPKK